MIEYNHFIKVFYRDVDQMGIVYYARYLEYFEEARTELLGSLDLSVSLIEDKGIQLPVIVSHCEYIAGAKLEDKLLVRTSIRQMPKASLTIEYSVKNSISHQKIVTGFTKHAFIDKEGTPKRVPKFILDKFKVHY